jgi:hypothetical protein
MNTSVIFDETEWLKAGEVDESLLRLWEQDQRIFKVEIYHREYYPRYQFDAQLRPLPVIKDIIASFKSVDPLVIAAWFHYPNGWLTIDGWQPIAPKFALREPELVLAAAKRRRGTYFA